MLVDDLGGFQFKATHIIYYYQPMIRIWFAPSCQKLVINDGCVIITPPIGSTLEEGNMQHAAKKEKDFP